MEANGTHILKLNIGNPAPWLPHAGRSRLRHGPPAHRHRRLLAVQGPVLRAQGHHAVRAAEEHPERHHRRHLHRQRRPAAHQPVHVRATRHRRRSARAIPGLPAVDRLREPSRRHRRALPVRRTVRMVSGHRRHPLQDHQQHSRRLSSSTRTTPPAHFTQRKCSSRSSTSRANTSSSSSPTKSTIASSWTACSTSPSPRWPRTCSA